MFTLLCYIIIFVLTTQGLAWAYRNIITYFKKKTYSDILKWTIKDQSYSTFES